MSMPTIDFVSSIPEPSRAARAKGGSEYGKLMRTMPAPSKIGKGKDAQPNIASFFVQASIPDTITDATERAKAGRDAVRRLVNQFTSLARRIVKEDPTFNFAFRSSADANGNPGLRVYRVAPASQAAPST